MSFEAQIAEINEHYFFREFTFSRTTFLPSPGQQFELADSIVWLGDSLIIFQLKERGADSANTVNNETRWFKGKVVKQGSRQIRDTLSYLETYGVIEIENRRGHKLAVDREQIKNIQKIICYLPTPLLPREHLAQKYHVSDTAGVIHLFPANDYLGVIRTLLTPAEVMEYLEFREILIRKWGAMINSLPEQALVGQYLSQEFDTEPNASFIEYLDALDHQSEDWDMSGIITKFLDRITHGNSQHDYYKIIGEIAKLPRSGLKVFKQRFALSMEKARSNEFAQPYRMMFPKTDCAFVFIPLTSDRLEHRRKGILNLTTACKYDLKVSRCVGVTFAPDGAEWYTVEWCFLESPWVYDKDMETRLVEANPFREVRERDLERYAFKRDDIDQPT